MDYGWPVGDWEPIHTLSLFCGMQQATLRGRLSIVIVSLWQGLTVTTNAGLSLRSIHSPYNCSHCACPTMDIDSRSMKALSAPYHKHLTRPTQPSRYQSVTLWRSQLLNCSPQWRGSWVNSTAMHRIPRHSMKEDISYRNPSLCIR